jgi:choline dehydrogenase
VIGAGTAGCVVAARLTEDPDVRVLLLESGPADEHQLIPVPGAWPRLWGTEVDYAYRTVPQAGLGGAEVSWPRGHTVGGSSSINGMIYLRGHRDDYDGWEREFGVTGWSYAEVLPYLCKSESVPGADPTWRGMDGPMRPARAGDPHPLSKAFLAAAAAAGYPISADLNGALAEGAGWNDLAVHDGRRQSLADAYLKPVLSRPNLTLATGSRAVQLLVRGGRCVGVSYSQDGQAKQAHPEAEVILSAGAIDSPRLLLLSGIGPADELRSAGVKVHHDLHGVGRNLHDHPLTSIVYSTIRESPASMRSSGEVSLTWRSESSLTGPDMQLMFSHRPFHLPTLQGPPDGFTFLITTVPDSRGSIRLRNADPTSPPLIDPNYLAEPRDLSRLLDAIGVVRNIAGQAPFDPWRGEEVLPGASLSHNELVEFVRRATGSYFHPVGTCAMGTGPDAVVDAQLRVRGLPGLRVVDASVMPKIVSVNTNVAVTGIAERAADLLTNKSSLLKEASV